MLSVILTGFQQTGMTNEDKHIPATRIHIEEAHGLRLFLLRHYAARGHIYRTCA